MNENSIYTVTPPDLMLLDNGPSITVLSTSTDFIDDVIKLYENIFKSVPVIIYHTNGPINDTNLAWAVSVMRLSDKVFVDLDTVNETGLVASILIGANSVYINESDRKPDIIKLFNIMRNDEYAVYENTEEYMQMSMYNNRE
jgi:hypothetical protein|tara:strand:+ start:4418 stop:4843 length:426 start_codon:yes stop_codon:yes gene_type:complete